jgi:hypothetical protein
MDLDRGLLARIDRKLLAGLGQDATFQMVGVPVTAAKWSTWKRYCGTAGISMGRAIMALIDRELVSVFGDSSGDDSPAFGQQAEEELASRVRVEACCSTRKCPGERRTQRSVSLRIRSQVQALSRPVPP